MTSGIYNDYSQDYHSPFKVSYRSRFFRVLLKLTSAEWAQVQSTALEYVYNPIGRYIHVHVISSQIIGNGYAWEKP